MNIMVTVNAMGDNCPIPVIKTKKAMQALTGPETIEVLVDCCTECYKAGKRTGRRSKL